MGEHEECSQPPSGLLPNGLLPNEAASVIRVLDSERWLKAEERTAELIFCIKPNLPSEERRNAVADYVERLINKCFPCKVFRFGSVPLKTYLPDGDIDLTAFSKNQNLKETWAHKVRDMLENEEKNENAEFHVKEVQYIQAEVKIIKCLVENIVVDISFNQLGGLCTLCFLEEVDHLINQDYLFKRSIILIKAWCYYESRILGAHHGLISTYALETLVLYIFHVFNNSFTGPLEVLYRFLEFFSKFDWDNFCVSLWGPVPVSSLPDVTAKAPLEDGRELPLSESLKACSSEYAVFPGGQENQGQPFVSKHFNVIDPLRVNNNLGRSVSKGNFFRIRSAFAFGAKRLARLLDCPKEDLFYEVNQFFMNTWERHGSGHRPDAPRNDLWRLRLSNPDNQHGSENVGNNSSGKQNDISSGLGSQADKMHGSRNIPADHANHYSESTSRMSDISTVSCTQSQKSHGNSSDSRTSEQIRRDTSSNQKAHNGKGQRSSKSENLVAGVQGRFLFARTRSSPELAETYGEVPSQGRHNRGPESCKAQIASTRLENNRGKNLETDVAGHGIRSSTDGPSSVRCASSHQSNDASDSNSQLNAYPDDLGMGTMNEEFSSVVGTHGMHQEEQDVVNIMASSTVHGFNGQVHFPLNLASGHLPLPIPPSVQTSMGYTPRNFSGIVPTNVPLIETAWGTNMQFPQRLVSPPLAHYFRGIGLASNTESTEPGNENFGSSEMNQVEGESDYWNEQELSSNAGFDLDNGSFEMLLSDDKQQSASAGYNCVPSTRVGGSGSSARVQQKFTKDTLPSTREDHADNFQYQDNRGNDFHLDERTTSSRSIPGSHAGSLRSKTSSESSWEGSSAKSSKSAREKRGRKTTSGVSSSANGRGKSVSEHSSWADDDSRDWNLPGPMGDEMTERNTGAQTVSPLHVPRHQMAVIEPAQTSGSDSLMPMAPLLLGPGSRPFAIVPALPPVQFVTMLPFCNFLTETGTSDASTSHFSTDAGLDNSDSGQNFDSPEVLDQYEVLSALNSTRGVASVEPSEHKPDILNSDFASHRQNLQYGRLCQNSQHPAPLIYSSSPVYLQGRFPLDGPGRPLSNNLNIFTQPVSYGPRLVPVAPLQPVSNRPASVYQRYADEMPRYRSGTGTYLPNPKVPARERNSASTRRGNYSYDRSYHHGDREGNWNMGSKARAAGRNHNRNQSDKPTSRSDRFAAAESRTDRPWGLHRHDSFTAYQSQNGPVRSNSTQGGSANVAYGMYPVPTVNPSGVSSNGLTIPSVVMLYPYDQTVGYGSPAEQLGFGSLGQVGFFGMNELSQLGEGSQSGGLFDEQRFHGASDQHSSPDQPCSPHLQRSVVQKNYQLKDEDFFPSLAFLTQGANDGGRTFNEKTFHYKTFLFSPYQGSKNPFL